MTAPAVQTSPRLDTEPSGGVFSYVGDTPPPCDPGGGGGGGPLTRLVRDILKPFVHGSPRAPVRFAGSALTTTHTNHHHVRKGTE